MPQTDSSTEQLRVRVFAGPNGSGKTTIINEVRNTKINGSGIDFGYYINADDITQSLRRGKFSFSAFNVKIDNENLVDFAKQSGLLGDDFTETQLKRSYTIKGNSLLLRHAIHAERLGQIIARYLREEMLRLKRRFSFETVFSHESNLEIMRRAGEAGYKVYLYFVSTESPEINKYRVSLRVKNDGHGVPEDKIEQRYYRSLKLLYGAAQLSYQAFSLIIQATTNLISL